MISYAENIIMAEIDDLVEQVTDEAFRTKLKKAVKHINEQKKIGLVFKEHLPECTPLYDIPIRKGCLAARKSGSSLKVSEAYFMLKIKGNSVTCIPQLGGNAIEIPRSELVNLAQFGEPIYPYLKPIASVCNSPDSDLWHTLIEAENYHAFQLLKYLYSGKVDCIYIDPPYNTGAKDWKYNNDYVDVNDQYRHSKWLSMMKKRLELAKELINPNTGVLICTIDEKEVHHLRTLLEQLFSEKYIQMVSIVINPKGSTSGRFYRVEEYALFCFMPEAYVQGGMDSMLGEQFDNTEHIQPRWKGLLRSGIGSLRKDSPNLFYPILVDENTNRIIRAETSIPLDVTPDYNAKIDGYSVAWPKRNDGSDGRWMLSTETFNSMLEKGYISIGTFDKKRKTWSFSYLSRKYQSQIENGELKIVGKSENGQSVIVEYDGVQDKQKKLFGTELNTMQAHTGRTWFLQ